MQNVNRAIQATLMAAGLIGCEATPPPREAPYRLAQGDVASYFVNEVDPTFMKVGLVLTPQASQRYSEFVWEWAHDRIIVVYVDAQIISTTAYVNLANQQIRCVNTLRVSTRERVDILIGIVRKLNPNAIEIEKDVGEQACAAEPKPG